MLVSTLEGNRSHRFQCRDSTSLENHLELKLPKFSLNMKNYCSIHLRLLHNLNEDRRHDIFMLNPECHLKFLEQNLNFLSRKSSRCNDFKMSSSKNSCYSVETSQKVFSCPEHTLPSLTFTSLSDGNVSQFKTAEINVDNRSSRETVIFDKSKIKVSNVSLQNKPSIATPPIVKIKEKYSSKKSKSHEFQSNLKFKPVPVGKTAGSLKHKTDSDTQFEFTVAGEKIVSFVCSPPSTRKQKTKESESHYICDSDEELIVSSPKSSSETVSTTSSKNGYSRKEPKRREILPVQNNVKPNMLLWHPPPTSRNAVSLPDSKAIYSCSSYNRQIKHKPTENCINFFGSFNSMYTIASASDQSFKSSHDQETVMFREAALRGCYDIESLLKEVKLSLPEVEKEVGQTREAIFSAVRLQKDNDRVLVDSILSIIDICNSWIKLNAHFERKEFKYFLELNGVDLSILGDFAQWQCMSRIFVDKLITVLKRVSICNGPKNPNQGALMRGSENSTLLSDLALGSKTTLNNNPLAVPIINTIPPTLDTQGKRWKQRRFLSEKIDSEKVALTKNRSCKSNATMNKPFNTVSVFHNPLLVSNCNNEIFLGQGDNGLNFTHDFSKVNQLLSFKSYQPANGDVSLLMNGPKQLNCSKSGFFDKNINLSNTKCSAKGETNMYPVTPDLCNSITNLVDMPLNHFFPLNIQQAVPTIPPLNNNELCLLNSNQIQPTLNHCPAKENPIQCLDTDVGEYLTQSSYMTPGHYTPPQKPSSFQKTVNNTVPIHHIPDGGIPFIYSAQHTSSEELKSLDFPNSLQIQMAKVKTENIDSEDTWKTALTMAGSLRDTMMADTIIDSSSLKLSETESSKSHFLLSDDNSQNSSSSGDYYKQNSDIDELSNSCDNNSNNDDTVLKLKNKTTDFLIESFNKIALGDENSLKSSIEEKELHSENKQSEAIQNCEELNKVGNKKSYFTPNFLTNPHNSCEIVKNNNTLGKNEDILSPKREKGYSHKSIKNNKKCRDDYTFFQSKPSMPYNQIFARPVSNEDTYKLEDILNCIWNTKVSALLKEEIKSEKEMAKLELKVRSPLYLQAMRCKLSNCSYDSLNQVLSDFQQYFFDMRTKNKGDKQCIEAISGLEQMFFKLVEKHFRFTYQASIHGNTTKGRRLKKTPRRI